MLANLDHVFERIDMERELQEEFIHNETLAITDMLHTLGMDEEVIDELIIDEYDIID